MSTSRTMPGMHLPWHDIDKTDIAIDDAQVNAAARHLSETEKTLGNQQARMAQIRKDTGFAIGEDTNKWALASELVAAQREADAARLIRDRANGDLNLVVACSLPNLSKDNQAGCAKLSLDANARVAAATASETALRAAESKLARAKSRFGLSNEYEALRESLGSSYIQAATDRKALFAWKERAALDRQEFTSDRAADLAAAKRKLAADQAAIDAAQRDISAYK